MKRKPKTQLGRVCAALNAERANYVVFGEAPTASIEDPMESKRTGRLQDAADIEGLEEIRRMRG